MKPQLGDTLFNRYTLVALLRDEPGIQAWKANDRVLDHDSQLFVITAPHVIGHVSSTASTVGRQTGFTPVLQFRKAGDAAVLVTRLEAGLSLSEYLRGRAGGTLSYEAMRAIIGEAAQHASGLRLPRFSTDTIRVASTGLEIAAAPLAPLLAEPTGADARIVGEQLTIRQLASVLYAMLTRVPSAADTVYDLAHLPSDMPTEFRVIIARGLELSGRDGSRTEPMLSLGELIALLGDWQPLTSLSDQDIILPSESGAGSIASARLEPQDEATLVELDEQFVTAEKLNNLVIDRAPSEAEAARHAERVVAEQNRRMVSQVAAEISDDAPFDTAAPMQGHSLRHLFQMPDLPERPDGVAAGADARGARPSRPARPERSDRAARAEDRRRKVLPDTVQSTDLFHDFSFQTQPVPMSVSDDFNPGEETTRIPVFSDPNQPTMAFDVSSIRGGANAYGVHLGDGTASSAMANVDETVHIPASDGAYVGAGAADGAGAAGMAGMAGAAGANAYAGAANGAAGMASDGADAAGTSGVNGNVPAANGAYQTSDAAGEAGMNGAFADGNADAAMNGTASSGAAGASDAGANGMNHAAGAANANGSFNGDAVDGFHGTAPSFAPSNGSGAVHGANGHSVSGVNGVAPSFAPVNGANGSTPSFAPSYTPSGANAAGAAGTQPPSFAPRQKPAQSAVEDEDLAGKKLFGGRFTAATVAMAVVGVVVVIALVFAVVTFMNANSNPDDPTENGQQWPDDSNVPFGNETPASDTTADDASLTADPFTVSEDVITIPVTWSR